MDPNLSDNYCLNQFEPPEQDCALEICIRSLLIFFLNFFNFRHFWKITPSDITVCRIQTGVDFGVKLNQHDLKNPRNRVLKTGIRCPITFCSYVPSNLKLNFWVWVLIAENFFKHSGGARHLFPVLIFVQKFWISCPTDLENFLLLNFFESWKCSHLDHFQLFRLNELRFVWKLFC